MALNSQNTVWGLFLVFESVSCLPTIIFKGFVKTQKAAGVNGIINPVNLVFNGTLWHVFLPVNLGFLIVERSTAERLLPKGPKLLKISN